MVVISTYQSVPLKIYFGGTDKSLILEEETQ